MKFLAILLYLTVIYFPCSAQLDNNSFEWSPSYVPGDSGRVYGGFRTLGYLKNNEYFNEVLEGYTLFGYQLNPYIAWQPGKYVRIEAGIYLAQNFGDNDFQDILPTFTLSYRKNGNELNFGTLQGNIAHRLIEPLYDFENTLSAMRQENGIQFRRITNKLFLDTWLDWRNAIAPGDTDQEVLVAGVSATYDWVKSQSGGFSTHVQATAYHRGGQINNSPNPIQTYLNTAFGIKAWVRPGGFFEEISGDLYYVGFTDNSGTPEIPFDNANGFYGNLFFKTSLHLGLMLSYWQAEDFYSPIGGRLYQTYSYVPEQFGQAQERRELLFLRFLYDKELADDLLISARVEPYFDLGNSEMEWAAGVYLNYRFQFDFGRKR